MAEQTPRINASYLEQFTHRTVRILGKVTQLRGEEATIDAGGQINVHLNRVCRLVFPILPPQYNHLVHPY
jgi:replication factor A3